MAKKRAPGGGRKSRGEYPGKTNRFMMRIRRKKIREGLERAAGKHGRSPSQEVEYGLRFYLSGAQARRRASYSRAW